MCIQISIIALVIFIENTIDWLIIYVIKYRVKYIIVSIKYKYLLMITYVIEINKE